MILGFLRLATDRYRSRRIERPSTVGQSTHLTVNVFASKDRPSRTCATHEQ